MTIVEEKNNNTVYLNYNFIPTKSYGRLNILNKMLLYCVMQDRYI